MLGHTCSLTWSLPLQGDPTTLPKTLALYGVKILQET